MTTNINKELVGKTEAELQQMLNSMESEYLKLTFDHASRGINNPLEIKASRRDIARVKTELRSRELAVMTPEQLDNRIKIRTRRRK
jgi:large subunit ribosomal protein L29